MKKNEWKPSNTENPDGTHFLPPLKFKSHAWYFFKMFDSAWCDKCDLSVLCLYIVNSLVSGQNLLHQLL